MTIQEIKHEFMAFRNGIVADTLRKSGLPFGVIFGLQLPQIREIGRRVEESVTDTEELKTLVHQLLADTNVRESRILAFDIIPPELLTEEDAVDLCLDIRSAEEADLLPFLLLRHTPHIPMLHYLKFDTPFGEKISKAIDRYWEDDQEGLYREWERKNNRF